MKLDRGFIFISIISIFLINCSKSNSKYELREIRNEESMTNAPLFNSNKIDNYKLVFHNNPYEFSSSHILELSLNHMLIFRGPYSNNVSIKVPEELNNQLIQPLIKIQKDKKMFLGNKKGPSFYLKIDSSEFKNILNVVFFPNEDHPDNFIMFNGWVE